MILLLALIALIIFLIYLAFDFIKTDGNTFFNKWTKKTLWIWLPFYALRRLIREMFFGKK